MLKALLSFSDACMVQSVKVHCWSMKHDDNLHVSSSKLINSRSFHCSCMSIPPCKNKEIMFMLVRVQTCTIWIGTMHVWWWGLIRFTISISCSVWIVDYFGIYESVQVHANANILTPNIFGKRIEAHMTIHVLTRGVISPKTYLRFFDTQNPLGPRRSNKRMTAALMRAALGLGIFLDQSAPMTWSFSIFFPWYQVLGLVWISKKLMMLQICTLNSLQRMVGGLVGFVTFLLGQIPQTFRTPNILETCISESGSLQELLQVDQLTMNYLTVSRIHQWHNIYHMCIYTYICIHMYSVHVSLITYVHICSIICLFIYDIITMLWIPLNSFEFHISFTAALVLGFTEPGHFSGFQHGFGFWIPRPPILQRLQHKTSSAWCQPCSSTSEGSDRPWKWKRVNDPKLWMYGDCMSFLQYDLTVRRNPQSSTTSNQNFKPL